MLRTAHPCQQDLPTISLSPVVLLFSEKARLTVSLGHSGFLAEKQSTTWSLHNVLEREYACLAGRPLKSVSSTASSSAPPSHRFQRDPTNQPTGVTASRWGSPRPIAPYVPASHSHRELVARSDGHILDTRLVHRLRYRRACEMPYSRFISQANELVASFCPYILVESFTINGEQLRDFSCEACRGNKRAGRPSLSK